MVVLMKGCSTLLASLLLLVGWSHAEKRLTIDTMSQSLRRMEYAVRGAVVVQADQMAQELENYEFDHIVYTNIGNPQSVGQQPLTWPRQVLALCDLPDAVGVDHPDILQLFPADAVSRAKEIKAGLKFGTGAYSHSKGVACLRQDVADFIQARDGVPSNVDNIFLTNGASGGIQMLLQALIAKPSTGVMVPIPQYPIYSATIDLLNGRKVGYYLDEDAAWALNLDELERSILDAKESGTDVVAFVLINPGNPTGQVLSKDNVKDIVQFCSKHKLVLLADEVYQENVYAQGSEFYSCKKAAADCGLLDDIELVSFHSVSKGVFGECGRRGGYMELCGMDAAATDEIYKLASSSLCSTVTGQIMTSLMVRGPAPSDVSFASHEAEKRAIFDSLSRRSQIVGKGLDSIPGFSCQAAAGSMYCFPSVTLPAGAIQAANESNQSPDSLYCVSLPKSTGICVVPASGFGQRRGRYGFRTTFLAPEAEMERCVRLIEEHHEQFLKEYSV